MFNFFSKSKEKTPEYHNTPQENFDDPSKILNFLYSLTGITFEKQQSILKSKLITFCRQHKIYCFDDLLAQVEQNTDLKQELINYLTTNETYFYREIRQIQNLVELVQQKHSSVKILCAPCATGEEVYSIAIALLESGLSSQKFEITGIDINSEAITSAKQALYKKRNLKNLSPELISKYFIFQGESFELKEEIKNPCSFKVINIFEKEFERLGKFDFVFSRNMLIYFDKETKLKAKQILESMRTTDEHDVFFGHADLF